MRIADLNWMQVEALAKTEDRAVLPLGSVEQHAYLSLAVDAILAKAGTDKSRILMVQIWLADMSTFAEMNSVYDTWVPQGHTAARAPRPEPADGARERSGRRVGAAPL